MNDTLNWQSGTDSDGNPRFCLWFTEYTEYYEPECVATIIPQADGTFLLDSEKLACCEQPIEANTLREAKDFAEEALEDFYREEMNFYSRMYNEISEARKRRKGENGNV